MKGDLMRERGLANRYGCRGARVRDVADGVGCGGEVWLGRGSEYRGYGVMRTRRDLMVQVSPLLFSDSE